MLRGRSSSLKGRSAIACGDPAFGRSLDPGDLGGPWGRKCGQARACPGERRGTPITTHSQDQKSSNYKIEVSTVSGDGHRMHEDMTGGALPDLCLRFCESRVGLGIAVLDLHASVIAGRLRSCPAIP